MIKLGKVDPVVAFLGRFQSHWIEQILLPIGAVGFSLATMVLLRQYARFFVGPDVVAGWVVLFGLFGCVVAVYAGNLFTHARAPILTHSLGAVVMLFLLYTVLQIGGAAPGTIYFSKASLAHPNVFCSLAVVFWGWLLATGAGIRIAGIGTLARSSARQVQEERDWIVQSKTSTIGMYERRRRAASFFKRRTLGYTLVAAGLAAVAFDDARVWEGVWMTWRWSVAGGTAALIFFGLVQQSVLVLYELRMTWVDENGELDVTPRFAEAWVKSAAALAAVAVGLAVILPSGFAIFDFRTTVFSFYEWSGRFFSQGVNIWNRYLLRGSSTDYGLAPTNPQGLPGLFEGFTAGMTLLFAAVATLVAALVLAGVIALFLRGEWRKLSALLKVPGLAFYWIQSVAQYFVRFGRACVAWLLRLLRGVNRLLNTTPEDRANRSGRNKRAGSQEDEYGPLPDSYIRQLFVRLIRNAQKHGLPPKKNQTPHEFAGTLRYALKDVDEDVQVIVDRYVEGRYGGVEVKPSSGLERAWSRVVDKMRGR